MRDEQGCSMGKDSWLLWSWEMIYMVAGRELRDHLGVKHADGGAMD